MAWQPVVAVEIRFIKAAGYLAYCLLSCCVGVVASRAGDINGDGYDDLIVGAILEDANGQRSGAAHVYLGGVKRFLFRRMDLVYAERMERIHPASSRDVFGASIHITDLNGDGLDDVLVGAPGGRPPDTPQNQRPGEIVMFRSTGAGLEPVRTLSLGLGMTGGLPGVIGADVWTGDISGGGTLSIATGAPGHPIGGEPSGAVILYRKLPGQDGTEELPRFMTAPGWVFGQFDDAANDGGDMHGRAIALADFDGDGRADLAAGTPRGAVAGVTAGQVFVYGGEGPVLPNLVGRQILTQEALDANEEDDGFGAALAAGDFDGDGDIDLAVGAPRDDIGNQEDAGYVFLFSNDGNGAFAPALRIDQAELGVNEAGDLFGAALASADFDRDGYADLVIGAPGARLPRLGLSPAEVLAEKDQVIRPAGGPSIPPPRPSPPELGQLPGRAQELPVRPGAPGPRGEPNWRYERLPFDDPIPGAHLYPATTRSKSGLIYLFRGSPEGLQAEEAHDQKPLGINSEQDQFGLTLATGDYNGDGYPDLAVGAPGFDSPDRQLVHTKGEVYIFYPSRGLPAKQPGIFERKKKRPQTTLYMNQRLLPPRASQTGDMFGGGLSH